MMLQIWKPNDMKLRYNGAFHSLHKTLPKQPRALKFGRLTAYRIYLVQGHGVLIKI